MLTQPLCFEIDAQEAQVLAKEFERIDLLELHWNDRAAEEQLLIARTLAHFIACSAPKLTKATRTVLTPSAPYLMIFELPVTDGNAPLLATALSCVRGEPFQYFEQSNGVLTAPIEPKIGAPQNSNASRDAFGRHTDDMVLAPHFRTEEIALLSVHNPPGTTTGFAILEDVL